MRPFVTERRRGVDDEQRLQWFGHMERMNEEKAPVKSKYYEVDSSTKDRVKKR